MMRFGRFWFSRFFSWRFLRLEPLSVKDACFIGALICMRTEEIALRLQEIRWKRAER
jgi:hypothetical protein